MSNLFEEVVDVRVKEEAVKDAVNEYLENNLVDGYRYSCTYVTQNRQYSYLNIYLQNEEGGEPWEDFDYDDKWEEFCKVLSNNLQGIYVSVPTSYLPK